MSVRRRPDGTWEADAFAIDLSGQRVRRRKVCPTKRAALDWERRTRELILRGEVASPPLPREDETVQDALDLWLAYSRPRVRPSTARRYASAARQIGLEIGDVPLARIGPVHLDALFASVASRWTARHASWTVRLARWALRVASERGLPVTVPQWRAPRLPEVPIETLSPESESRLLASSALWRAPILVALDCGLRCGEVAALQWADVDLSTRSLIVRRTITETDEGWRIGPPKGGKERRIPITMRTSQELSGLRPTAEWVFPTRANGYRTGPTMRGGLQTVCDRAGLRVNWHTLRHTYATRLVSRGAPIHVVAQLLGHAEIRTTARYLHLEPGARERAVALLETDGDASVAMVSLTSGSETPVTLDDPQGIENTSGSPGRPRPCP